MRLSMDDGINEINSLVRWHFKIEGLKLQQYPSETSQHYGYPKVPVTGTIMGKEVSGIGCYDREVFDKLLKPGEIGWMWQVVWLNDGTAQLRYLIYGGNESIRVRLNGYPYDLIQKVKGEWPRTKYLVGYEESLSDVFMNNERIGVGFREFVGFDGIPEI